MNGITDAHIERRCARWLSHSYLHDTTKINFSILIINSYYVFVLLNYIEREGPKLSGKDNSRRPGFSTV